MLSLPTSQRTHPAAVVKVSFCLRTQCQEDTATVYGSLPTTEETRLKDRSNRCVFDQTGSD